MRILARRRWRRCKSVERICAGSGRSVGALPRGKRQRSVNRNRNRKRNGNGRGEERWGVCGAGTHTSSNTLAVSNRCRGMLGHRPVVSFISSWTIAERISDERAGVSEVSPWSVTESRSNEARRTRRQPIRRHNPTLFLPLQRKRQPKRHSGPPRRLEWSIDSLPRTRSRQHANRKRKKAGVRIPSGSCSC